MNGCRTACTKGFTTKARALSEKGNHGILQQMIRFYLETDAPGIGKGTNLLQARDEMWLSRNAVPDNSTMWPIAFPSKSFMSADHYSNIEIEVLGILHGLEEFHHYCFIHEVSTVVTIFKKDVESLSPWLLNILLSIHQYNIRILY